MSSQTRGIIAKVKRAANSPGRRRIGRFASSETKELEEISSVREGRQRQRGTEKEEEGNVAHKEALVIKPNGIDAQLISLDAYPQVPGRERPEFDVRHRGCDRHVIDHSFHTVDVAD